MSIVVALELRFAREVANWALDGSGRVVEEGTPEWRLRSHSTDGQNISFQQCCHKQIDWSLAKAHFDSTSVTKTCALRRH
ncbi:UNVERIFIED_ORG: hypothetical protein J2Y81_007934 [Paraburkholderia sediminicola]|nr:hypothetical protein [Paraburkholderia sediminicola]